jgi:hypothetical protein
VVRRLRGEGGMEALSGTMSREFQCHSPELIMQKCVRVEINHTHECLRGEARATRAARSVGSGALARSHGMSHRLQ